MLLVEYCVLLSNGSLRRVFLMGVFRLGWSFQFYLHTVMKTVEVAIYYCNFHIFELKTLNSSAEWLSTQHMAVTIMCMV